MRTLLKEDIQTEFKSAFNDGVIESLTAFANTIGGRVLIGVDDKGKSVKGFTIGAETLQKWVNEVKNKTQPSIIPDANVIQDLCPLSLKTFSMDFVLLFMQSRSMRQ